jgi:hypothetical protein
MLAVKQEQQTGGDSNRSFNSRWKVPSPDANSYRIEMI